MTLNLFWPIGRIDQICDWHLINSDQSRFYDQKTTVKYEPNNELAAGATSTPPPTLCAAFYMLKRAPDFPIPPPLLVPATQARAHMAFWTEQAILSKTHFRRRASAVPK